MEIVQRILNKVVGHEISAEELERISGGAIDRCAAVGGYGTLREGDTPWPDGSVPCDFE